MEQFWKDWKWPGQDKKERSVRPISKDRYQAFTRRLWYKIMYPGYCRDCEGWGVHHYTENMSPNGSGMYWPMDMTESCYTCGENGVCPRCGVGLCPRCYKMVENAPGQPWLMCPHCRWDESQDVADDYDGSIHCPKCGWDVEGDDGMWPWPEGPDPDWEADDCFASSLPMI